MRIVSEATTTELRDNVIGQNDRYGIYVDTDGPFTLAGNTILRQSHRAAAEGAVRAVAERQLDLRQPRGGHQERLTDDALWPRP